MIVLVKAHSNRRWKPSRPWTSLESLGVALGYGLLSVAGAVLPVPVLLFLSRLGTRALLALSSELRESLDQNARHVLGPEATEEDRRILGREVLASVARHAIELVATRPGWPRIDAIESRVGAENFERAAAAGRGVLGVTLHMGNYEVGAMLVSRFERPVAVVFTRDPDGFFDRARSRRRRKHRVREIAIDAGPLFTLEVRTVLRANGFALLAGDISAPGQGSEVHDFLGGRAHFPKLPARLAVACGSPVLPCFVVRGASGRYRLELASPIFPEECASPQDLERRLIAVFEGVVRRYPEQWLVLHPFWEKSDPRVSGARSPASL
jgi:KDO2-lipid IV(A) lauroyltransferase